MAQSKVIPRSIAVGTAGWSIPRASADAFGVDGSHLERYARVMPCVEINSSFYRPHRVETYARWRDRTPDAFRFSVKMPKAITHEAKLACDPAVLDAFVAQVAGLGAKLAVLLVQLAPSHAFVPEVADDFFAMLRARHPGGIACEPRHASWFEADANDLLIAHRVTRAAADPARVERAAFPGGWLGPRDDGSGAALYYRWHGAPRAYWSPYDDAWLAARAAELLQWPADADCWCIFDNTGSGAALADALRLARLVQDRGAPMRRAVSAAAPR